jgi:cytochrome c oxidase cbb3-type subunit 3
MPPIPWKSGASAPRKTPDTAGSSPYGPVLLSPRLSNPLLLPLLLALLISPFAGSQTLDRGKQTFTSSCASCHGLDARGGERAPNIADNPKAQRLSDAQISRLIENGIAGTGMPAFHSLNPSDIKAVVTYLRTLQGANNIRTTTKVPGNPNAGEIIFFGKAACSTCHMIAGKGGYIASDLSAYASAHNADQVRGAIAEPASGSDRHPSTVTITIRGGEKYVGRIRNEDNFSLQLQALDGTFHFITKSDVEAFEYSSQTLMPSNYATTLSATELNDVISYLMTVPNPNNSSAPRKPNEEE